MKYLLILVSVLALVAACGTQERAAGGGAETDTSRVLATVGQTDITEMTVEEELERIPPYQRATFETPEGRRMLVNHLVEKELLVKAAEDLGLDEDSFVVAQVELAMQQVEATRETALIQAFYQQEVVESVTVPEEEVVAYYEEHVDDIYHQDAQVRASHVVVETGEEAAEVQSRLEAGEDFGELAAELSIHEPTAEANGDMGWMNRNAPLPYLGNQEQVSAALFEADSGEVIGPMETTMGIHLFEVTGTREEGPRPLEEVYDSIEDILRPSLVNSYFENDLLPQLHERYGVTIDEQAFLPDESVPADTLLQMAQNLMETNPEGAIQYFELFLERYPEHERAHQAQFLIGFTYSEQLGDFEQAGAAYQAVLDSYPESDFADDAQWMIDNMGVPPEEIILEVQDDTVEIGETGAEPGEGDVTEQPETEAPTEEAGTPDSP